MTDSYNNVSVWETFRIFYEALEIIFHVNESWNEWVNPFPLLAACHMETSHLICTANQMTGFYMKCNNWWKWVNFIVLLWVK